MKTTIDIADPLFEAARKAAHERGTTLRALVELGLRQVLDQADARLEPFKLKDASFKAGTGLSPEAEAMGWDAIREMSYGDRAR